MCNDMVNRRFGKLVVEKYVYSKNGRKYWLCKCDCGNEKITNTYMLTSGKVTSCGCKQKNKHGDMTRLLGKKFNRLTVVAFDHFDKRQKDYWKCKCDCGNYTIVQGYNITSGKVKSCGCFRSDLTHETQFEDLTGKRFGMLTVEKCLGKRGSSYMWLCKCDCGRETKVFGTNLTRLHTTSCGNHNLKEETAVRKYIESFGVSTYKTRKILPDKQEIDIYIPELKIGIEYNGSAFHSTVNGAFKNVDKYYHRDKFLQAKNQGIHLISIFDIDWNDKVKVYLKDLFTTKQKVYARNCTIKSIDKNIANEFCDKYHLQNHTNLSSICYGLYYNDELLSVMTFGKRRLKKQQEGYYELHRYCVKSGYTIIGGANKLLNHFIQDFSPKNILSYSDNDYFDGSIYERLGFKYIKQAEPNYYWFRTLDEWYKREQCQVQKLKDKFPQYYQEAIDNNASNIEEYIMTNCFKCKKVYRSGNTRWEIVCGGDSM